MKKDSETPKAQDTEAGKDTKIVANRDFRKAKARLIEREKNNYNKIILIERSGEKTEDKEWYEFAEHSALIYYYQVCMPLGEQVKFAEDTNSYYDRYKIGLICTNGLNRVKMLVRKAGLYESEKKEKCGHILILKKTFTTQEMAEMERREMERRRRNNQIIPITFSDPELYIHLRNAGERLHRVCNNKLDKLSMITTGKRMVVLIDKVMNNYQMINQLQERAVKQRMAFWKAIYSDMRTLAVEVQTAVMLKVMNSADGMKICAELRPAYEKIKEYHDMLEKAIRKEGRDDRAAGR